MVFSIKILLPLIYRLECSSKARIWRNFGSSLQFLLTTVNPGLNNVASNGTETEGTG